MEFTWLSRWQAELRAILRIVVGLLFLEHALIKLFGFPPGGAPGLQQVGTLLWIGGVVELLTSILVIIGLFTRIAAFVAAGEMAIAYFMAHYPRDFFPANNGGDAAISFCFIFLYLVFAGAGAFALDNRGNR